MCSRVHRLSLRETQVEGEWVDRVHFNQANKDFKKLREETEGKYLEFTEKKKKDKRLSQADGTMQLMASLK